MCFHPHLQNYELQLSVATLLHDLPQGGLQIPLQTGVTKSWLHGIVIKLSHTVNHFLQDFDILMVDDLISKQKSSLASGYTRLPIMLTVNKQCPIELSHGAKFQPKSRRK